MNSRIKFKKTGFGLEPTEDKYILLFYYLSDLQGYIDNIDEKITEFISVQNEEKTFEEIYGDCIELISVNAGEFEYSKDTAYFISNNPEAEPSMEMPLQELIDLLMEWKDFLLS